MFIIYLWFIFIIILCLLFYFLKKKLTFSFKTEKKNYMFKKWLGEVMEMMPFPAIVYELHTSLNHSFEINLHKK